ncbi:aluminum-activated malate transporter 2 [Sesamum indicum]|uniref:Aluminum-activated malate transporter 2 n=1 Tax=Sesamum indicum TaxID=4182 RepID=A0A6I9T9C5_SESIN|nr:aluminum-activated malate transporter 2 [Sesamum indicum]
MIAVANGNNIGTTPAPVGKPFSRRRCHYSYFPCLIKEMGSKMDTRRVIHSMKLGLALVFVSLVYLINSMFKQVGENAMWAIMTVVVMFEFHAGGTLGKGINRGIGTVLGGVLGCLAAILGDEIGGIGKPVIIAFSLFLFGAAATYCRLIPRMKKRYDYGFMIFILTFSLVAVSGVRAENVLETARDRLANIGIGFAVSVFVSLLICPFWASNELHYSTASKFDKLANCIQGCLDEYLKMSSEKENEAGNGKGYVQDCKSVLNSKSSDELLANNAKWEPWHGKFGFYYPWEQYLVVGEHLRELAATLLSLKACLQSPKQPPTMKRQMLKDPCESFALSIGWAMKELGESIEKMELCPSKVSLTPKLQSLKLQMNPPFSSCKMEVLETDENLAITSFNFLLLEIVEKVETIAKKVEELGEVANFRARKIDV